MDGTQTAVTETKSPKVASPLNQSRVTNTAPKSIKEPLHKSAAFAHHDPIKVVRDAHIRDREGHIDQLIQELKERNEGLKAQIERKNNEDFDDTDHIDAEVHQRLEKFGADKMKLEAELETAQLRIKQILAENQGIESEMASYDAKTRKILEARQKKLDWENHRLQELEREAMDIEAKRQELNKKAQERDLVIQQRREVVINNQAKQVESLKEEKKISEVLRGKISEYESILREHKRLQGQAYKPPSKVDQAFNNKMKKQEKTDALITKIRHEEDLINDMNKKLEKLKSLEQKVLDDRKVSQSQKGMLKSQFQDVMNKKLEGHEITELLSRDKIIKSPTVRRKSLTRIIEDHDREAKGAARARSPGAPTMFVGGNLGSHTEQRKLAKHAREQEAEMMAGTQGQVKTPPKPDFRVGPVSPEAPKRFASPQNRFARPAHHDTEDHHVDASTKEVKNHTVKPSTTSNARPGTAVRTSTAVKEVKPKIATKPSVPKHTIPTSTAPKTIPPTPAQLKKESLNKVSAAATAKTTMRGKGTTAKKEDKPSFVPSIDTAKAIAKAKKGSQSPSPEKPSPGVKNAKAAPQGKMEIRPQETHSFQAQSNGNANSTDAAHDDHVPESLERFGATEHPHDESEVAENHQTEQEDEEAHHEAHDGHYDENLEIEDLEHHEDGVIQESEHTFEESAIAKSPKPANAEAKTLKPVNQDIKAPAAEELDFVEDEDDTDPNKVMSRKATIVSTASRASKK